MGADLYINKLTKGMGKAWESKEGYFRDSYNGTSVLWTLGLSWWQDVAPKLNRQGNLSGKSLKEVRDLIANAKQANITETYLKKQGCAIGDGSDSVESWQKYFKDKRNDLIIFLDRAIKLKLSISCSL